MNNPEQELVIPHNTEVEQALLGAILVNNDALDHVAEFLHADHFYEQLHSRIYAKCQTMLEVGDKVSPVTLKTHFENDETIVDVGGPAYLARLASAATTIVNCVQYGRIVHDLAMRRTVIGAARQTVGYAHDTKHGVTELVGELIDHLVNETASGAHGKTRFTGEQSSSTVIERLNSALQGQEAPDKPIPTGYSDLDRAVVGWRRERFYVIGARPSMGKTAMAICLARRAIQSGHGVLLFSLEMSAEEISERILTDVAHDLGARIPYENIARGSVTDQQMERLIEAQRRLADWPLLVEQKPGLTIGEIRAIARQTANAMARQGKRLDLVITDHMGLVRASDRYSGNKVAETEEVSAAHKAMAKDLGLSVVALLQLSRATEAREDKRPTLADLRWSGAIEQDADVVMFPFREAYQLERKGSLTSEEEIDLRECRNKLELIIAKNRGGPCRSMELYADMASNAIRNSAHQMEVPNGELQL